MMRKTRWHDLLIFGYLEARACIFAGSFFFLLFISQYLPLGPLPRYDFLFLSAVLIQIVLVVTKIETKDEVKTILLFHLLGLGLELFKTHPSIGSWSYPEEGYFKIGTVPLYSGFMYAAVGSYLSQAWRLLKVQMINYPLYQYSITLCAGIYLNFFTHHFIPDFRYLLAVLVIIVFRKTWVQFIVNTTTYRMPIVCSFLLVGFFIWIAENISTYFGAWKYPNQAEVWHIVSFSKISSWALLVIISFIIVGNLKIYKERHYKPTTALPPDDSSAIPRTNG